MIFNQWVPAAHQGDAVGDHARQVRNILRRLGHNADVFAMSIDDGLEGDVLPWTHPAVRDGDVTMLHFAVSSPMTAAFATIPGTRVLQYHNVTPASFFAPFDAGLAAMAARARQELASLAGRVDLALGASEFNRAELEALGFASTATLPIAIDLDRITSGRPVPALEAMLDDGLANILFVGRLAPNKKIEDHLRMAEHYKRHVDSNYRFVFVGRSDVVPRYHDAIRAMMARLDLPPDRFWFTGAVPIDELSAYYRHAHAYVSLSEHEGFGVPLVEAMAADVPVLAYAATAVPETMGGAGVTFAPKDLEQAAELLGALVYDEPVRAGVIAGQRRRVNDFSLQAFESRLTATLGRVM